MKNDCKKQREFAFAYLVWFLRMFAVSNLKISNYENI